MVGGGGGRGQGLGQGMLRKSLGQVHFTFTLKGEHNIYVGRKSCRTPLADWENTDDLLSFG